MDATNAIASWLKPALLALATLLAIAIVLNSAAVFSLTGLR